MIGWSILEWIYNAPKEAGVRVLILARFAAFVVLGTVIFLIVEIINNKINFWYSPKEWKREHILLFGLATPCKEVYEIIGCNAVAIAPLIALTIINWGIRHEMKSAYRFLMFNNVPLLVAALSMFLLAFFIANFPHSRCENGGGGDGAFR